jgi:hypothetical protein
MSYKRNQIEEAIARIFIPNCSRSRLQSCARASSGCLILTVPSAGSYRTLTRKSRLTAWIKEHDAFRREGESTVVKRVRLKRKARSQSKVVSSAPSVPSVPSATPDPSEQPSPPSMMGEPRKRALKKQSDYVGWCERRALVQSRWLTRDYPCARSATRSAAAMLKRRWRPASG